MVIKELKSTPYLSYSVLRFPGLFQKYGILDKSLSVVQENDIIVFLSANKNNLTNLNNFHKLVEEKKKVKHQALRDILKIAHQKQDSDQLIEPFDP